MEEQVTKCGAPDLSVALGHLFSNVPGWRTKVFGTLGIRPHCYEQIDNGWNSSVLAYAGLGTG